MPSKVFVDGVRVTEVRHGGVQVPLISLGKKRARVIVQRGRKKVKEWVVLCRCLHRDRTLQDWQNAGLISRHAPRSGNLATA